MNGFLNQLAFGWYPYLAITVLIVGSILRFDANQYSWRSQSSQFLRRKQMMWGSNLLHIGILVLFVGHFVGLLTPVTIIDYVGIGHGFKQLMALIVGGIAGIAALIGATLLLHRRLFEPRVRRSSQVGDFVVLILLWLQVLAGVSTTFWTMQHLTGEEMLRFMGWANAIITFNPEAPNLLSDAAWIYKLHIILGLTLFLITPFTRLVHIWSVPVWYLLRPGYQIVRSLGPVRRTPTAEIYAASPNYGSRTLPNYGGTTVMRQHTESGESGA